MNHRLMKNAIHHAVIRAEMTGAEINGFVLMLKLADGNYAFQAQNVTPAEYVAAAKAMEENKGEIHQDRQLGQ